MANAPEWQQHSGVLAGRFVRRAHEEEIERQLDDDVGVQLERLAERGRELVADVEALRLAIARERGT